MSSIVGIDLAASRGTLRPHAAGVAGVLRRLWKAWRNRREFYRLGEMSDAELADIGLTRTDLSVVVASPFGIDPTARLGAIANARIRSAENCRIR